MAKEDTDNWPENPDEVMFFKRSNPLLSEAAGKMTASVIQTEECQEMWSQVIYFYTVISLKLSSCQLELV